MNNKLNGKIYKITNPSSTKCYYGSTHETLDTRFTIHKNSYKCYKNGVGNKVYVYDLLDEHGVDTSVIELIEDYPCNTKKELRKREGVYIRANFENCYNKSIAGRNLKEYYIDNKEKFKVHNKAYYEKNKEQIRRQQRLDYNKKVLDKTSEEKELAEIIGKYLRKPLKITLVLEFHFDK